MTVPHLHRPVHAFTNDVLASHDGTALAQLIRAGELSVAEVTEAAINRARQVEPAIHGIAAEVFGQRLAAAQNAWGTAAKWSAPLPEFQPLSKTTPMSRGCPPVMALPRYRRRRPAKPVPSPARCWRRALSASVKALCRSSVSTPPPNLRAGRLPVIRGTSPTRPGHRQVAPPRWSPPVWSRLPTPTTVADPSGYLPPVAAWWA